MSTTARVYKVEFAPFFSRGSGGGRGDDGGDDRSDARGDMVGFGAAQVRKEAAFNNLQLIATNLST